MAADLKNGKAANRRIKSHLKSRRGCGNCKLRKIKCDERRPGCTKCEAYQVQCNYDANVAEMQPCMETNDGRFQVLQPSACSEIELIISTVNRSPTWPLSSASSTSSTTASDRDSGNRSDRYASENDRKVFEAYHFTQQDLECLHRFDTRTMATLGQAKDRSIYRRAYTKLAFTHPFLLHVILTVTILHDSYLKNDTMATHRRSAAFHWLRGAALLNHKLSNHIHPDERDALWACAGLLGALSFSDTTARSPYDAWPLSSTKDLAWLNMIEGKKAIWKLADPVRPDSIFYPHMPAFVSKASSSIDVSTLPQDLLHFCRIDLNTNNGNRNDDANAKEITQTVDHNPYLPSLGVWSKLLPLRCNAHTVGQFMSFFGHMTPAFKSLLRDKDPPALLLLAYWYTKQSEFGAWWIWPRARTEALAICIYLRERHGSDDRLEALSDINPQNEDPQNTSEIVRKTRLQGYEVRCGKNPTVSVRDLSCRLISTARDKYSYLSGRSTADNVSEYLKH